MSICSCVFVQTFLSSYLFSLLLDRRGARCAARQAWLRSPAPPDLFINEGGLLHKSTEACLRLGEDVSQNGASISMTLISLWLTNSLIPKPISSRP